MRKIALISLFLLSVALANVEIKFDKTYYTILPIENKINLTVKNLLNKEVSLVLNIFPSTYNDVSCSLSNYFIDLKPFEEKTIPLTCIVPLTTSSFSYKLSVFAYLEGKLINETFIILNVVKKYDILITSYKILKDEINPNEKNYFEVNIKNIRNELSEEYFVVFQIEKNGKVVKSEKVFIPKLVPQQEYKANYEFSFSYFDEPGTYFVYAKVYNKNDVLLFEVYKPFILREVKTYEISKKVEQGLYISTVKIKVKNTGNVPQTLEIKETVPSFVTAFLKFYQEPKIEQKGASSEIIWQVYVLPQQETEIVYEFVFWPVVVAASVIGVVSIFLLSIYFTPLIGKFVQKEENIYKIRLVAKNTSRKTIKNVIIKDFVPNIFQIVEFETKKPEIKRTKEGYHLTWNIPELKP
ncbi:MAG: hypothetical protein QXQ14_02415, partial [Candidatus Aenigmatarchaeota archaeon]